MSKERLEEIKIKGLWDLEIDDLRWLIKQAERVEELEGEIKTHAPEGRNYTNKQYVDLLQKNQRYKQALERILENWKTSNGSISGETIAFNSKEIARQALEREG